MEKRYQVFVSSTYRDLEKERQEVMQALLELDCFPAGMELFPAADMAQWELIKKVIDDSDYYLLILGGRYGSLGPDGLSYTEMEYDYAVSTGKPTVSFFHKDPSKIEAGKCETSEEGRLKMEAFRSKVQSKICKSWSTPSDLGSVVSRSIIQLIRSSPGIGWVRANQVADGDAKSELIRQRSQIDALESELKALRTSPPEGAADLANGDDIFIFHSRFEQRHGNYNDWETCREEISASWAEIFSRVAPLMINSATEAALKDSLDDWVSLHYVSMEFIQYQKAEIDRNDFATIIVQLRALGLIMPASTLKSGLAMWTLTPYGDQIMTRSRAIAKKSPPAKKSARKSTKTSLKK